MQSVSLERWKRNRMTILVGMIGSDGILLAADQRMTGLPRDEKQFDDHSDICKITHLKKHKVAYARVGDPVSKAVGAKISADLDAGVFDFDRIESSLDTIAAMTIKDAGPPSPDFDPGLDRSLLFVFYGDQVPDPQLWKLRISPAGPDAERITGMVIGGASGNGARFFERYFERRAPISTLTFLASHIVLTAGHIDPVMIGGLDVAVFDTAGCRFLNDRGKGLLNKRSKKLDQTIRAELFRSLRKRE